MNWQTVIFSNFVTAFFLVCAACVLMRWLWRGKIRPLQEELSRLSEDMLEMVELQTETHSRFSRNLADIEERIFNLSAPSSGESLALERRYQVLALARKGMSLEEIAERLNMSRGEADLILRLRRYADPSGDRALKTGLTVKSYA